MANKWMKHINNLIALIVTIAVGGFFADGTTLTLPILSIIPAIIHTIIGWVIIIGGVIDYIQKLI